ncbi:ScbA/BarX family gamma-butyrolactone biosynthesis protein [Streptomyces sp. AN091965]|uniref:ScbA/BarX family gamma-butyrolactone biosynthesis protein n=1 Tax=Streptomyces sp. AN091965 TaxID=2927803 RepID=UPI002415D93F|nr:ScbA/BarX family gamma-butyrolactone biosynthesis protein [Streptomyces sp. AN091965]
MPVTQHLTHTPAQPTNTPAQPTLAPHHVHKHNPAEVLLTGYDTLRPDTYTVTAQWPTHHPFYTPTPHLNDPLLFIETIRQCFPLLAHNAYHLPHGHHLIWQYLTADINPHAMHHTPHHPTHLTLYITCSDIRRRQNGHLTALTLHAIALRNGTHLGTAQTRFSAHSPTIYQRIRGNHPQTPTTPPPPTHPTHVGRHHPHDVVLSPTPHPHHWTLRNDTTHPTLFDHPVDHTPGMLLLEAARQATHATHHHNNHNHNHNTALNTGTSPRPTTATATGTATATLTRTPTRTPRLTTPPPYPTHIHATFLQFLEYTTPTHITTTTQPGPDTGPSATTTGTTTHITATQNNQTAFTSTITTTPHP